MSRSAITSLHRLQAHVQELKARQGELICQRDAVSRSLSYWRAVWADRDGRADEVATEIYTLERLLSRMPDEITSDDGMPPVQITGAGLGCRTSAWAVYHSMLDQLCSAAHVPGSPTWDSAMGWLREKLGK